MKVHHLLAYLHNVPQDADVQVMAEDLPAPLELDKAMYLDDDNTLWLLLGEDPPDEEIDVGDCIEGACEEVSGENYEPRSSAREA